MPSNPLTLQFLDDVATALSAIAAGATYHFTVESVRRYNPALPVPAVFPTIELLWLGDSPTATGQTSFGSVQLYEANFDFAVIGIHRSETPQETALKLEMDIKTAIAVDPTRGNNALDTHWTGTDYVLAPDAGRGVGIVRVAFRVRYQAYRTDFSRGA